MYCGFNLCKGGARAVFDLCASLHSLEAYNDGLKAIFIHEKEMYRVYFNDKSAFLDLMYGSKLDTYYWIKGIEQSVDYTNNIKIVTLQVYDLRVKGTYRYNYGVYAGIGRGMIKLFEDI